MRRGTRQRQQGLALGFSAALLLAGGPGGGHGPTLVEGRRRRRPAPPPEPAGVPQQIEQKALVPGEKYNYNQALYLSLLFYEAQRSGKLPEDNRIPWRRDSNIADGLFDAHTDLSGGWYDAGDYILFGWPMAFATTTLTWGLLEYEDAYNNAGEWGHMLESIKWPLDWLIKAHVAPDVLYTQVGAGTTEHRYWGRAEFEHKPRPAYQINATAPGTEPAADAAAAMAAGSLAFQHHDPIYSKTLLIHAKQLFEFAFAHQAQYKLSAPYYESHNGFLDELAWAAAWLYKATGDKVYLDKATTLTDALNIYDMSAFGWDSKNAGVHLLMYKLTKKAKYADNFKKYMLSWTGKEMKRTPKGLAYYMSWGPLRWAANTAFLSLVAADMDIEPQAYRRFAKSQIHYMLGDNGGFSYVVGFGEHGPRAIHNRGASCGKHGCVCSTAPSANTLYGALVGGPDEHDVYVDDCKDYKHSECSVDYNAGFQSAVAGLKHLSLMGLLDSF